MGCLSNPICNAPKYNIKSSVILSDVPTNLPKALNGLPVPFSLT